MQRLRQIVQCDPFAGGKHHQPFDGPSIPVRCLATGIGASVIPDKGPPLLNKGYVQSTATDPVLTATQDGIPQIATLLAENRLRSPRAAGFDASVPTTPHRSSWATPRIGLGCRTFYLARGSQYLYTLDELGALGRGRRSLLSGPRIPTGHEQSLPGERRGERNLVTRRPETIRSVRSFVRPQIARRKIAAAGARDLLNYETIHVKSHV